MIERTFLRVFDYFDSGIALHNYFRSLLELMELKSFPNVCTVIIRLSTQLLSNEYPENDDGAFLSFIFELSS